MGVVDADTSGDREGPDKADVCVQDSPSPAMQSQWADIICPPPLQWPTECFFNHFLIYLHGRLETCSDIYLCELTFAMTTLFLSKPFTRTSLTQPDIKLTFQLRLSKSSPVYGLSEYSKYICEWCWAVWYQNIFWKKWSLVYMGQSYGHWPLDFMGWSYVFIIWVTLHQVIAGTYH